MLVLVLAGFFIFSEIVSAETVTSAPNGIGHYDQWSLGAGSTKTNAVADNDGDTSYIYESSDNDAQTFTVPGANLPAGAVINSVTLNVVARESKGSAGIQLRLEKGTGGSNIDDDSTHDLTGSYATYSRTLIENPFTDSAWTLSEVNSWTTRFGIQYRANAGNTARITQISVVVDYTLDITPPVITINNPNTLPAQSKTITAVTNEGTLTQSIAAGSVCDATLIFAAYSSITFSSEADNGKKVCYRAIDAANNITYGISDAILGIDRTGPTVTVNQDSGQADPTDLSPINFTVIFSESVSDFTGADVTISGTEPGSKSIVVTGSGTTYNIAVSGMTAYGTVIAGGIAAAVAHDAAGNASSASSSADNNVTFDNGWRAPTSYDDGGDFNYPSRAYTDNTGPSAYANATNGKEEIYGVFYFPTIPVSAVIDGIEVQVKGYRSGNNPKTFDASLSWDNSEYTTAKNTGDMSNTQDKTVTLGGATDKWGRVWLPGDFINANFKVKLYANAGQGTLYLNFLKIKIYYTPDTVLPTFTVNNGTNVGPGKSDTINVNISEAISSSEYGFSPDSTCDASDTYGNLFSSGIDFSIAGDHADYLCVKATDLAGNIGYILAGQLNTDNTAPSGYAVFVDQMHINDANKSLLSFTFSGAEIGTTYNYSIDDVNPLTSAAGGTGTILVASEQITGIDVGSLDDGVLMLGFALTDTVGNSGTLAANIVTKDTAPPIIGFTDDVETGPVMSDNIAVSFISSVTEKYGFIDEASDCVSSVDISEFSNYSGNFQVVDESQNGKYICAYSEDATGNKQAMVSVDDLNIDTAVPSITINNPDHNPAKPVADPVGGDYQNDIIISLSSTDENLDAIYYTLDTSTPDSNSSKYNLETKINITMDATLKAVAYDKAGNVSEIMTEIYGIAPVISGESSSNTDTISFTAAWTTDDPSTSRVIYDTVSHPVLDFAPNYGYANSTTEDSAKVTNHSVIVSGLNSGVTYYCRTVSHGSPESVSGEVTVTTIAVPDEPASASSGSGGGGGLISLGNYTGSPLLAPVVPPQNSGNEAGGGTAPAVVAIAPTPAVIGGVEISNAVVLSVVTEAGGVTGEESAGTVGSTNAGQEEIFAVAETNTETANVAAAAQGTENKSNLTALIFGISGGRIGWFWWILLIILIIALVIFILRRIRDRK